LLQAVGLPDEARALHLGPAPHRRRARPPAPRQRHLPQRRLHGLPQDGRFGRGAGLPAAHRPGRVRRRLAHGPVGRDFRAGQRLRRRRAGGARRGDAMSLVNNLWKDMVDKRLWPVALVLVVALVAIPVVLAKPAPKGPAAPTPVASASSPAPLVTS